MARSFESDSDRKKRDTITLGDSLIFLTTISPSKSIRLQKYYWTIDNRFFANEYSFKGSVFEPGQHQIAFVLIDFFGDTLSDTLTLFVSTPPELNTQSYIPLDYTQSIDPSDFLSFVWEGHVEDSLWQVSYDFTLKDSKTDEILVDTTLHSPQFTYTKGFKTLNKYEWTVKVRNQLNQTSQKTLQACFFTSGIHNESGISGILKTTSSEEISKFNLTLLNETDSVLREIKNLETDERGFFELKPLNPGSYSLIVAAAEYEDFSLDTIRFSTTAKILTEIPEIILKDNVNPTIQHESKRDTINIADTLKFFVHDGGGKLSLSKISAQLESTVLPTIQLSGDTLLIPLPSFIENSWTFRVLTVSALDHSGNKISRTFYIRPKLSYEEVRG